MAFENDNPFFLNKFNLMFKIFIVPVLYNNQLKYNKQILSLKNKMFIKFVN